MPQSSLFFRPAPIVSALLLGAGIALRDVPSAAEQDRLLAEMRRVLRPGGLLIGVDSIDGPEWRDLHTGDICVPIDPSRMAVRLQQAGFVDIEVQRATPEPARRFRFAARAPATP